MTNKLKEKIRNRLVFDYGNLFSKEKPEEKELRRVLGLIIDDVVHKEDFTLSGDERTNLINGIIDEFLGFGPIEPLMKDPTITEIMINGPKKIYIERQGKTELSPLQFDNEQQVKQLIHKILEPTRRRVDESYPFTDVSLKDGSRVNIILYPIALEGPVLTIRKFLKGFQNVDDLVRMGTLDNRMGQLLVAAVKAKVNVIFAGATGAGKTTTLNVLSYYIPEDERIITIEDTAEINLNQEHVVRLETRQPNIEGKGEITIRDLFRNSLRMRPGRIILGEIRGKEALDMLQAICSGHTGSLSVIHADSPEDVVYRLETLILTSSVAMSIEAIHRQIAASLNLLVQQEQLVDGSRKITRISQVCGLKDGHVVIEDLFYYDITSVNAATGEIKGSWKATGARPAFLRKLHRAGVTLSDDIFRPDA